MAKLYPPVIEGTIPAFYGTTLVVPFSMNRAVAKSDIKGFSLKIKTVQTNTFVKNLTSTNYTTSQVVFDTTDAGLVAGQYYKLQLAYIFNDNYSTIGYYSTVGVVKYYGETGPKIYVDGLSAKNTNMYTGTYLGVFEHPDDPMEKVAQYRFMIIESDGDVVTDTGWLVHNTINDINSLSSNDSFKYMDDLDSEKVYYLYYKVITSNNMECSTPGYRILQKNSVGLDLNIQLEAENHFDNGYISIRVTSDSKDVLLIGSFEISRQNIKNPNHWEPIFMFVLQGEAPGQSVWRDFTVEQGETYRYCVRQFNISGMYSDRIYSNEVYADFEDAFLFDGERQLKIRYNPKVSSFKNDILESKTDTIGSKYPFIFRNGHVNYKEFPLSGLISYWMDEEELFMKLEDIDIEDISKLSRAMTIKNDISINHVKYRYNYDNEDIEILGEENINTIEKKNAKNDLMDIYEKNRKYVVENFLATHYKTTDLTNYNIAAERKFKLEVLEWLTNGKPKLFRSPGEGNYIIRLLNTSLTPTDTVGRMLHTFNSTAYEISEITHDTLVGFGFLDDGISDDEGKRVYYRTVPLGWQGVHFEQYYQLTQDEEPKNYKNYYYIDNSLTDKDKWEIKNSWAKTQSGAEVLIYPEGSEEEQNNSYTNKSNLNEEYKLKTKKKDSDIYDKVYTGNSYKLLNREDDNFEILFNFYKENENLFERNYNPVITGLNEQYPVDEDGYVELLTNPYNKEETLKALSIRFDDMSSTDIIYVNGERRMIGGTGVYNLDNGDEIYSVKVRTVAQFDDADYQIAYKAYTEAINELKGKIGELEKQNDKLTNLLEDDQAHINEILNSDTSNIMDETVIEFNKKIKETNEKITKNNEELKILRNKLNAVTEAINKKQADLDSLKPENLQNLDNNIAEVRNKISVIETNIQELAKQGYERQVLIFELQKIIAADNYEYQKNKEEIDAIIETLDERKHFVEQLEEMKGEIEWLETQHPIKNNNTAHNLEENDSETDEENSKTVPGIVEQMNNLIVELISKRQWSYRHCFSSKYGHYYEEYDPFSSSYKTSKAKDWKSQTVKTAIEKYNAKITTNENNIKKEKDKLIKDNKPETSDACKKIIEEYENIDKNYDKEIADLWKIVDNTALSQKERDEALDKIENDLIHKQEDNRKLIKKYQAFLEEKENPTDIEKEQEAIYKEDRYNKINKASWEINRWKDYISKLQDIEKEIIPKFSPLEEREITLSWKYFYPDNTKEFKKTTTIKMGDKPSKLDFNRGPALTTINNAIDLQNNIIKGKKAYVFIDLDPETASYKYRYFNESERSYIEGNETSPDAVLIDTGYDRFAMLPYRIAFVEALAKTLKPGNNGITDKINELEYEYKIVKSDSSDIEITEEEELILNSLLERNYTYIPGPQASDPGTYGYELSLFETFNNSTLEEINIILLQNYGVEIEIKNKGDLIELQEKLYGLLEKKNGNDEPIEERKKRLEDEIYKLIYGYAKPAEGQPIPENPTIITPECLRLLNEEIEKLKNDLSNLRTKLAGLVEEKTIYVKITYKNKQAEKYKQEKKAKELQIQENLTEIKKYKHDMMDIPEPDKRDYLYGTNWDNNILNDYDGIFTYSYVDDYRNTFDMISGQSLLDIPCKQINSLENGKNIINDLSDIRTEVMDILQIQAEIKQVENIYVLEDEGVLGSWKAANGDPENPGIDPEVIKGHFSLDSVNLINDNELELLESNAYIYQILPILTYNSWNKHSDETGIMFGFVTDKNDDEPVIVKDKDGSVVAVRPNPHNSGSSKYDSYIRLSLADNIEGAEWHAPKIMFNGYGDPNVFYYINILNESDYSFFSNLTSATPDDNGNYYSILYFKTEVDGLALDTSGHYQENRQYYTKGEKYIHVTYPINSLYYTNLLFYEVLGSGGNYYVNFSNPYYNFTEDNDNGLFLVYDESIKRFRISEGYSNKVYINTGVKNVDFREGNLYDENNNILQPYLDITQRQEFKTELIPKLTDIYIGNGIILNLSYHARQTDYTIEGNNKVLKKAKEDWENALNEYTSLFYTKTDLDKYSFIEQDAKWEQLFTEGQEESLEEAIADAEQKEKHAKELYNTYLKELQHALDVQEAQRSWEKYQEINGYE